MIRAKIVRSGKTRKPPSCAYEGSENQERLFGFRITRTAFRRCRTSKHESASRGSSRGAHSPARVEYRRSIFEHPCIQPFSGRGPSARVVLWRRGLPKKCARGFASASIWCATRTTSGPGRATTRGYSASGCVIGTGLERPLDVPRGLRCPRRDPCSRSLAGCQSHAAARQSRAFVLLWRCGHVRRTERTSFVPSNGALRARILGDGERTDPSRMNIPTTERTVSRGREAPRAGSRAAHDRGRGGAEHGARRRVRPPFVTIGIRLRNVGVGVIETTRKVGTLPVYRMGTSLNATPVAREPSQPLSTLSLHIFGRSLMKHSGRTVGPSDPRRLAGTASIMVAGCRNSGRGMRRRSEHGRALRGARLSVGGKRSFPSRPGGRTCPPR
jgi:hypothetical protein